MTRPALLVPKRDIVAPSPPVRGPLIQVKAPYQPHQGMVADDNRIVRPGGAPPIISPHCRKCRIPVEHFAIDAISSWYHLGIRAECHGVTTGIRVSAEQALKEPLIWMF